MKLKILELIAKTFEPHETRFKACNDIVEFCFNNPNKKLENLSVSDFRRVISKKDICSADLVMSVSFLSRQNVGFLTPSYRFSKGDIDFVVSAELLTLYGQTEEMLHPETGDKLETPFKYITYYYSISDKAKAAIRGK